MTGTESTSRRAVDKTNVFAGHQPFTLAACTLHSSQRIRWFLINPVNLEKKAVMSQDFGSASITTLLSTSVFTSSSL